MADAHRYVVRVIGEVRVNVPTATVTRNLSAAPRSLLATLVAAGPEGIDAGRLAMVLGGVRPVNQPALRMAVTRLRDYLPEGVIPDSQSSRYSLRLPTDAVDAWHLLNLADAAGVPAVLDSVVPFLLSPDEPFDGVDGNALIDQASYDIRAAQRALLRRLDSERPGLLTERLLPFLKAHRSSDPWNENLLRMAATRTAQAGDRRGALAMIAAARLDFHRSGMTLGPEFVDLERQLLEGPVPELDSPPQAAGILAPTWFLDLADEPLVGSTQAVDLTMEALGGTTPQGAVLTGPSGAGKTRTLAEIQARADRLGWAVTYLAPSVAPQPTLGAFLAAYPNLHDLATQILEGESDAEMRRVRLLAATRDTLFGLRPGRPLAVLVDDAHWLDSLSIELLTHLVGASTPVPMVVVAAGRGDAGAGARWSPLRLEMVRRGGIAAEIPTLDDRAMAQLVENRQGPVPRGGRRRSAAALVAESGGLPGIALVLLSALDGPIGMRPAASDLRSVATTALTGLSLDDDTMLVGGAAAVLHREFELGELDAMVNLDPGRLVAALDVLIRHDLIEERVRGRFRVAHALIEAALLSAVAPEMAMAWHATAGEQSADVHEVAYHLANAVPLVSASEASQAGLRSAHRFLDDGLYPEAARAFDDAEALSGGGMARVDGVAYSRALDLAGRTSDANRVRSLWFARAVAAGDHDFALDVATSGLPEAEPIDGSTAVVDLLGQVDPSRLSRQQRWRHARHASRQMAIVGDLAEAGQWADQARELAMGPAEEVAAALTVRFAQASTTDPLARVVALETPPTGPAITVELRAEYWLIRAIDLYEAGERDRALEAFDRFRSLPGLPAVRSWHAMLLDATLAAEDGRAVDADVLRTKALEFGTDAGLAEASNGYLVGFFVDCMVEGMVGGLVAELEAGTFDPSLNLLTRAAAALALDAAGHDDEATAHAEAVAAAVTARPISQTVAALALAAAPLARSADVGLRERSLEMLRMRGNSLLVVGAGAACLGPIRRYAAHLARDQAERDTFLDEALDAALRAGSRRWIDVLSAPDIREGATRGRGRRVAAAGRGAASRAGHVRP